MSVVLLNLYESVRSQVQCFVLESVGFRKVWEALLQSNPSIGRQCVNHGTHKLLIGVCKLKFCAFSTTFFVL